MNKVSVETEGALKRTLGLGILLEVGFIGMLDGHSGAWAVAVA